MSELLAAIAIFIATAVIVTAVLSPGLVPSVISRVTGTTESCLTTPYDSNCYCAGEEERIEFNAFGVPKFICEPINKFIDPNDPNWEQESINYTEQVLQENYPDCDMNTCSNGQWYVSAGARNYENRIVSVECRTGDFWDVGSKMFAYVDFFLVNGTVVYSTCSDYYEPQPGNPTIQLTYDGLGGGYNMHDFDYRVDCSVGTGLATGSIEYIMTSDEEDATNWWFHGIGYPQTKAIPYGGTGTCALVEKRARSVVIECEYPCTGYGDFAGELTIRYK